MDPPVANGKRKEKRFREVVCRKWLRGHCKKGDACGFLHQHDKDRMPVCRFFAKFGSCREPDCAFKHTTRDVSLRDVDGSDSTAITSALSTGGQAPSIIIADGPSAGVAAAQKSTQPARKRSREVVCRNWLEGKCKEGDVCGFLHEYDEDRMPVCQFLTEFGECWEPGFCIYKHSVEDVKESNTDDGEGQHLQEPSSGRNQGTTAFGGYSRTNKKAHLSRNR